MSVAQTAINLWADLKFSILLPPTTSSSASNVSTSSQASSRSSFKHDKYLLLLESAKKWVKNIIIAAQFHLANQTPLLLPTSSSSPSPSLGSALGELTFSLLRLYGLLPLKEINNSNNNKVHILNIVQRIKR